MVFQNSRSTKGMNLPKKTKKTKIANGSENFLNSWFSKIPEVQRKEFAKKKKRKKVQTVKKTMRKKTGQFFFSNICPALLRLVYFLTLMTGQAYLTIAAVVSVLG